VSIRRDSPAAGVIRITVGDAHRLEAHDQQLAEEFCKEMLLSADKDDVKAIIVRVESVASQAHEGGDSARKRPLRAYLGPSGLYEVLALCKKVVVAELPAPVSRAAALIGLYSDLAVADESSHFPCPFDTIPEANFMLAALSMRLDRAKAWLLSGEPLTASGAEEAGLVNEIVHADALADRALQMATRAAAVPLDGITVSKMNMNACLDAMGVGQDFDLAEFYGAGWREPGSLGVV
jgi:enoyl-CoA hydratase/carnithine racemase